LPHFPATSTWIRTSFPNSIPTASATHSNPRTRLNVRSFGAASNPRAASVRTTGLHFDDVQKLLAAFRKLIEGGGSLLVIEHNLDVIKSADWVIDMGPEGGNASGEIVATGTPEQIAANPASHTGHYLALILNLTPPK
jgi:hypothetical protein